MPGSAQYPTTLPLAVTTPIWQVRKLRPETPGNLPEAHESVKIYREPSTHYGLSGTGDFAPKQTGVLLSHSSQFVWGWGGGRKASTHLTNKEDHFRY